MIHAGTLALAHDCTQLALPGSDTSKHSTALRQGLRTGPYMLQKSLAQRNERRRAGGHQWYKCVCTCSRVQHALAAAPAQSRHMTRPAVAQIRTWASQILDPLVDQPPRTATECMHTRTRLHLHSSQPSTAPAHPMTSALRQQQGATERGARQSWPATGCSMQQLAPCSTAKAM